MCQLYINFLKKETISFGPLKIEKKEKMNKTGKKGLRIENSYDYLFG